MCGCINVDGDKVVLLVVIDYKECLFKVCCFVIVVCGILWYVGLIGK